MRKAFVFDFDDTLAKTDSKVLVYDVVGNCTKLSAEQYNHYIKREGDRLDFREWAHLLNPVGLDTLELAKQVSLENHSVYILTARASNAKNPIAEWLANNGVEVKEIYCVGDTAQNIAKEKRNILLTIVEGYDRIYYYDDNESNVVEAKTVGVKAYKV